MTTNTATTMSTPTLPKKPATKPSNKPGPNQAPCKIVKMYNPMPGVQIGFSFDKERVAKAAAFVVYNTVMFVLSQIEAAARAAFELGQKARPVADQWVETQIDSAVRVTRRVAISLLNVSASVGRKVYNYTLDKIEVMLDKTVSYFTSVGTDIKVSMQGVFKG